jgi:hypothetical protein
MQISIDVFNNLVSPLIGKTVSLPWKGYGSALFLEIGELQPLEYDRQIYPSGEACLMPNFEWRIEDADKIICGSSDSLPKIDESIKLLQGLIIKAIILNDKIPELNISFSNGFMLRTMSMYAGEPEWYIKCLNGKILSIKNGSLVQTDSDSAPDELSDEEKVYEQLTEKTVERWGVLLLEPVGGNCNNCKYFVCLNGNYYLLDYGVCISDSSQYDGRVVNRLSGCPDFSPEIS